jgi:regulator of replication initiation timing
MPDKLNNVETVNEIAIELEEARARAAALLAENRAIKTQFELERIKRRLSDLSKKRRGAVTVHMSKRIVSLAEALLKNGKSVIKLEEPAPIYLEDDERPEMTDEIDIIEEVIDMLEEVVESVEGSSSDESEPYGEELEKPGTGDWDDDLEEEAKAILSQKPELKLRDAYVLAELKLTEKRKGVLKNGR